MSEIQDAAPRNVGLTLAEFMERRGYDPETRTYKSDESPDMSGSRNRQLRSSPTY